jgi:hypothetical protein
MTDDARKLFKRVFGLQDRSWPCSLCSHGSILFARHVRAVKYVAPSFPDHPSNKSATKNQKKNC